MQIASAATIKDVVDRERLNERIVKRIVWRGLSTPRSGHGIGASIRRRANGIGRMRVNFGQPVEGHGFRVAC